MAAAVRQGDQRGGRSSATGNYTHSVRDSLPGIPLLTRVLLTLCLYKSKWRAVRSIAALSGWSVFRYSARSSKVQRLTPCFINPSTLDHPWWAAFMTAPPRSLGRAGLVANPAGKGQILA